MTSRRLPFALVLPLAAWLASRLIMVSAFAAGARTSNPADVLAVAGKAYDAGWYTIIATEGYAATGYHSHAAAFYPGYPILVRLVTTIVPSVPAAMVIVSNLALLGAAVCLYRIYALRWGPVTATLGLGVLLCSPEAIFLGIGFSEAAFLAAVAATFLAAERQRWVLAGAAAAAASVIRFNGALLAIPLLMAAIEARAWRNPQVPLGAVLLALGVATYPAYLALAFGDPLRYVHLQATFWHHHLTNPLIPVETGIDRLEQAIRAVVENRDAYKVRRVDAGAVAMDGTMICASVAVLSAGWWWLRPRELVWIALVLVPPLLVYDVPDSVARYLLAAFPIYFFAAKLFERVPAVTIALMLAGLAVQAELAFRLAQGYFVA